ncbi:hypothetical protein WR25_19339 isoform D [Diploscapter pachys]|uniref:Zinc/iron permease n=1 Tax=Diploscapter pachys TaxID=2018661 RepID=A0A2A2K2K7_9BILA|nr:hypothetical protein WR25_19339 isoform B [Diploscapter pachys]PAV68160.1 hypothetical protein WR25_19339 isoform D [Diploscapter pachys]
MNLIVLKLIFLVVMIVGVVLAGLLPLRLLRYLRRSAAVASTSQQHRNVSLILCLLTCFSGGVFLATCFLHLFPELVENLEDLESKYGQTFHFDYPVAELLSCLGFFVLFLIEEVVILAIPSMAHGHSHGTHALAAEHSVPPSNDAGCCMTTTSYVQAAGGYASDNKEYLKIDTCADDPMIDGEMIKENEETAGHCQKHCPLTVHTRNRRQTDSGRQSPECNAQSEHFTALTVAEPERCETNCENVKEDPPILMKSQPHAHSHGVRSITFVLALSIHEFIEGIAFGVVPNETETTALFISLMIHKLIVSFSLGLQLARTHAHQLKWVIVSIFILSLTSPIGALLGMLLKEAATDSMWKDVMITTLQGLAVGTFLYVTFFEVLIHERDNEHPNLLKLLVMFAGFTIIGLLRLQDNGHTHGHHLGNETLPRSMEIGNYSGHDHSHH